MHLWVQLVLGAVTAIATARLAPGPTARLPRDLFCLAAGAPRPVLPSSSGMRPALGGYGQQGPTTRNGPSPARGDEAACDSGPR